MASNLGFGQASLQKARFFIARLSETEEIEPFDQEAAEAYLEAAILFGKVTQYSIETRIKLKNTALWNDPLCKFLADLRDFIVHKDGSAEVIKKTSVTVSLSAAIVGVSGGVAIASVTPANPTPWQRVQTRRQRQEAKKRMPILQEREHRRMRRRMRELREEALKRMPQTPEDERKTEVHFVVPPQADAQLFALAAYNPHIETLAATNVVAHYLDVLNQVLGTLP